MSCTLNGDFLQTVCEDWKQAQYCDGSTIYEDFQFTTNVPLDKVTIDNNTIHFPVSSIEFKDEQIMELCPNPTRIISVNCSAECNDYDINDAISQPSIEGNDAYNLYQFWVFLFFMVVSWSAQAVVVSIGDAICFEILGEYFEESTFL